MYSGTHALDGFGLCGSHCLRGLLLEGVLDHFNLSRDTFLVPEWIHFTLFGIKLPTITLKVYTFGGL